jgi:nickel-dependent lactate racemase
VKGITAAAHVVKPGGTILLVAACTEGVGGPEFGDIMRRSTDWKTLLRELEAEPNVTVDQWQAEKLAMVAEKAKLAYCVPGVSAADQQRLWGPAYGTPQEAVDALLGGLPRRRQVVVIPDGPYVFSLVRGTPVGVG